MNAARELLTRAMQPLAVGLSLPEKEKFAWHLKTRQDGETNPGLHLETLPAEMVMVAYDFLRKKVGVQAMLSEDKLAIYIKQDLLPRQGLPPRLPGLFQQYANSDQSPLRYRSDISERLLKLDSLLQHHDAKGYKYPDWGVRATLAGESELNYRLPIGSVTAADFEERGLALIGLHKKCGITSEVRTKGASAFLLIYGQKNIADIVKASPPGLQIYLPSPPQKPQMLLTHAQP